MAKTTPNKEIIVRDAFRGLWYHDGALMRVLEPGRYEIPHRRRWNPADWFKRYPEIYVRQIDMRERDLTIKGQEILTSDKVAIRVSIVVRYRVVDPQMAVQIVDDYESRIYTDVQLAARRSLSSMTLEDILTNRNKLNEDILEEVTESATSFGVEIKRADVKDLIFPGDLQTIMNRVLTAERQSQAQLIEARTRAEVDRLEAQTRAERRRIEAQADEEAMRLSAQAEADAQHIQTEADIRDLQERAKAANVYVDHPVLVRLMELETLRDLSQVATARLYIDFDKSVDMADD
ncbi:MAG: slipin family protein [Chloroflexi bacterium]|nr:slipin family protein [Chloroflexota bacterium]